MSGDDQLSVGIAVNRVVLVVQPFQGRDIFVMVVTYLKLTMFPPIHLSLISASCTIYHQLAFKITVTTKSFSKYYSIRNIVIVDIPDLELVQESSQQRLVSPQPQLSVAGVAKCQSCDSCQMYVMDKK